MGNIQKQYAISVIIPIHNTAPYLKRCIDSVRNQLLEDIEIILVDNKSDDMSPAICDEYAEIDSRIKVLHLQEAGASIARNAGLKIASAPYIGFVDSDDHIDRRMYRDLLSAMELYHADVAYCNFCHEYADGRIEHRYENSGNVVERKSKEVVEDIICDRVSSSPCTKLFKKELFESILFPEGVFWEDHAVVYQWVALADKVVWVDREHYFYYQHEGSVCHTLDWIKHYHYFLAEYPRLDFVKRNGLYSEEERPQVIDQIVRRCFYRFTVFMEEAKFAKHWKPTKDMRRKMKRWLSLSPDEIDAKIRRRVKKIVYIWPWCYWKYYRR